MSDSFGMPIVDCRTPEERRIEELERQLGERDAVIKEAKVAYTRLLGWRRREWPHIPQEPVLARDFPLLAAALAATGQPDVVLCDAEPVAWIHPNHLQEASKAPFLCRVVPGPKEDYVPLYARRTK